MPKTRKNIVLYREEVYKNVEGDTRYARARDEVTLNDIKNMMILEMEKNSSTNSKITELNNKILEMDKNNSNSKIDELNNKIL